MSIFQFTLLTLWCLSGIILSLIYIINDGHLKYIKNHFKLLDISIMCIFGPLVFLTRIK